MSPYASLFGPRRMKPNPSESEAIRDPLGRDSYLWDQEEEQPDLNGKLESARADWRGDASLNSLFGVNGAFTLEDTVGKNGKNRPGDVFKVQSLLHREGLLDADKTAGPTGFLGIYDHEAIEKFQKENGLKQDGWLGPKGETIKAFESIYQPAGIRPQPQPQQTPQPGWKDYSLNLFDPKTWAIWDKMDERERNFYEQQAARQAQTETITGGSGQDDVTPVQPAQQEDKLRARLLPAKRPPVPQTKPDLEVITRGQQEVEAIKNAERAAIIAQRNAEIDDYLDDPRVQAFLDTLGHFESRGRYDVITGGGRFTDMSQHPNKPNEQGNTAAGKYQFTKDTWDQFSQPVGAEDFSAKSQDRIAIYMLQKLKAVERLLQGDVEGAIMNAGKRWAAFPKDSEGRNIEKNGYRSITPIIEEYKKRLSALQGRS